MSWEVKEDPSCHSRKGGYLDRVETYEECCLEIGDYTLHAFDQFGDGWHGGFMFTGEVPHFKAFVGDNSKEAFSKFKVTSTGFYDYSTKTPGCVDVDFSIKTTAFSSQMSWNVEGTNCYSDDPYPSHKLITKQCCLMPGEHTLNCIDNFKDGWDGGYLLINGKKYCQNFRSIKVESKFIVEQVHF